MSSSDPRTPAAPQVSAGISPREMLLREKSMATGAVENWRSWFPEIIGRSAPMLRVLETVSKIARSDSAVLIFGESGTGKELIAKALHRLSARSDRGFVAINCSAIPEQLLESELFGHERGSFTGAEKRRIGKFELAAGGTIFLDEIGDMPAPLQAKLLRVLQEKRFTPLGSNENREADVRIVAATNVDLEAAVQRGAFRLDLFYRLNVLPIPLPPLRERREDIPALLEHFLEVSNRAHPGDVDSWFSPEAITTLTNWTWPGNIRELQNLVERAVVMRSGGMIGVEHLPDGVVRKPGASRADEANGDSGSVSPAVSSREFGANGGFLGSRPTGAPQVQVPNSFGMIPETVQIGVAPALPTEGIDLISFIEQLENSLIVQALERTQGNKNQAAKLLGLNRTTLVERIKKRKISTINDPAREL